MNSTDKVLAVRWQGQNRRTSIRLFDYAPKNSAGDPLVAENIFCLDGSEFPEACEETADGYTMPGTVGNGVELETGNYGSQSGLRMETRVAWTALKPDATGPFSVGFHISSAQGGQNLQNLDAKDIEDNMDGPGGNALIFADPFLEKEGPEEGVGFSGQPVTFTLTLGNNGPDTATGIKVTDRCEDAGFDSFHSAEASSGSYDPGSGVWSVSSLAPSATATLTLRCLIDDLETEVELTNEAEITGMGTLDKDLSNNSDSATVTVVPMPDLTIVKFSNVTHDPVNGSSQPKRIPGAWVTYTVKVVNTGFGSAETVEITDLLPDSVSLYTGDFADPDEGPVIFKAHNSGLTYTFPDDLELLDANDGPVAPNGGFNPAVQRLRVSPQGTFQGKANSTNGDDHTFELQFRVRID